MVRPPSGPTIELTVPPTPACRKPITAAAVPARSPCRVSARAAALDITKPSEPRVSQSITMRPIRPPTSPAATSTRATASSAPIGRPTRSRRSGPTRRTIAALTWAEITWATPMAAIVRRVGPLRLLRVGLPMGALLAVALVLVAAGDVGGLIGLIVMLWLTLGSLGFVMSNAAALALTRHGERAGTAAAVIGFLQAGVGGTVSSMVG